MAAFYIGFSIAGGRQVILSLDTYFDRKFGSGKKYSKEKIQKSDNERLKEAMTEWHRVFMAGVVALMIMFALMAAAGFSKSFWLIYWIIVVIFTVGMWWVIGPLRLSRKANKG